MIGVVTQGQGWVVKKRGIKVQLLRPFFNPPSAYRLRQLVWLSSETAFSRFTAVAARSTVS